MAFLNGFFGNLGADFTGALTQANNPFGLAPPQGMSPEMAGRMPYLDLGTRMLANSQQRPLQAAAGAFQGMKESGMEQGTKRLWAQQVQGQMQEAQEERENKKRMAAQLQALLHGGGGQPSAAPMDAAGTPQMQPGATPDMPQLAQQVFDPTVAQPVPQPMQQQGQPGQQFTPQQKFQAQYWLSAGNPQKAMEVLFKSDPTNWQTVTTDEGVFAFNPETRQMEKIGERPTRNEGEGRPFMQTDKLRDDYTTQTKPFAELRTAYQRMVASYEGSLSDETGASDIAMVYNYMKMLDPTSVVREGEFATAQNAGGVPEAIRTYWNRLKSGDRLDPSVREAFLDQATKQYESQLSSYGNTRKTFKDLATRNQLDPEQVAPDYTYGVTPYQRKSKAPDPLGIR